jgi:hypothetical protein
MVRGIMPWIPRGAKAFKLCFFVLVLVLVIVLVIEIDGQNVDHEQEQEHERGYRFLAHAENVERSTSNAQ